MRGPTASWTTQDVADAEEDRAWRFEQADAQPDMAHNYLDDEELAQWQEERRHHHASEVAQQGQGGDAGGGMDPPSAAGYGGGGSSGVDSIGGDGGVDSDESDNGNGDGETLTSAERSLLQLLLEGGMCFRAVCARKVASIVLLTSVLCTALFPRRSRGANQSRQRHQV